MTEEVTCGPCFLCEQLSEYYEFDGDKRRHYRCIGAMCGEYVITDTARRRLEVTHAASWRKQAAALATRVSDEAKILEIWVNPSTRILETHLVERSRKARSGELKR